MKLPGLGGRGEQLLSLGLLQWVDGIDIDPLHQIRDINLEDSSTHAKNTMGSSAVLRDSPQRKAARLRGTAWEKIRERLWRNPSDIEP